MKNSTSKLLVSVIALLTFNHAAIAQGTAFTYQGRLNDNGSPATGIFDLRFAVCDAVTNGSYVSGPLTNMATPVAYGLFGVTLDFGAGVFTGPSRWLELGVRTNGGESFVTLVPRQPITAAPYSIFASGADVANTATLAFSVAPGSITSASLTSNSVTAAQLASGAAAANLAASGQGGVAGGGMILSSNYADVNLIAAGYVKLGKVLFPDFWDLHNSLTGGPSHRTSHTAVWSGQEMIVWGGWSFSTCYNDGARYNPIANAWTPTSTNGAPKARTFHSAVWTGSQMIVWGGWDGTSYHTDGARYDPALDIWIPISTTNAPSPRYYQTAVWTGSKMIVWGGISPPPFNVLNDGASYDPIADTWTLVTTNGAPSAREFHAAVWTGNEMIIWGGDNGTVTGNFNTGARYNPVSNQWTPTASSNAPSPTTYASAIWTGLEMILASGGRYNPNTDTWQTMAYYDLGGRIGRSLVWTGTEMIVCGGHESGAGSNIGARYNVAGDFWTPTTTNSSPAARSRHTAVWTGNEMIIFGGQPPNGSGAFRDVASYNYEYPLYLYQKQ